MQLVDCRVLRKDMIRKRDRKGNEEKEKVFGSLSRVRSICLDAFERRPGVSTMASKAER
jgi:hypothetical protein